MMAQTHETQTVGPEEIAAIRQASRVSARRRAAQPIHKHPSDPVQRVLMAAEPDTYVGPHRHPTKAWEMILLLEGEIDILCFDEAGIVTARYALSEGGQRLVEYPALGFHAAVVGAAGAVVLEIKEGPYDPATAKALPDWAPEEGEASSAAFRDFMRGLQPGDAAGSFSGP